MNDTADEENEWTVVVPKEKKKGHHHHQNHQSQLHQQLEKQHKPPRAPREQQQQQHKSSLKSNSQNNVLSHKRETMMGVTGGVDSGESTAGSRRNSLNLAERRRQGGGYHHQREQKIKSSNSWDALRQHDAESKSDSEESQEEFEDAKEKLHHGDRDRAGGEETNNNKNKNNDDDIGLGEEEEELRRKQRRKEKKKLRRKMKAAQLAATKEAKDKGELEERNDARETSAMAAATTTMGKLGSSAKDIDKSATVPANVMNRSVESFESFNSFGSVSDEEMDDANEEWKTVENKRKKSGSAISASNSAKMATMRNNLVETTELATTSMSSSSQHLHQQEHSSSEKKKKKKNKRKSSKKEEEDKGGSSSGYSSEPESPLGTDSSFSLSTPNGNSSQENIAHMKMRNTSEMKTNTENRLNMNTDASPPHHTKKTTPEKKLNEGKTTSSASDNSTTIKKKSAVDEIAQMITKNSAFDSDDDEVSERRRKQHEREKSSTRFPSTEKLIVLPPNLTSTSPIHRSSSPSLTRARRESDESSKINALRRQLSSASRQQQQQKAHHVHTTSSERTFSEDLPLVPGRWAHIVNKLDEWVYFFTDVFWKSLGAFLSTILNWFRGGTSKKTEEAQRRARANLKRIRKENSSQNLLHMSQQSTGRTPTYTSGSDAGYLTPPYLPSMAGGAKAPATQIKIPAVNAKKYSGKNQKDNFGLDNRAILNPYLGCFGGAGDRAPGFRRAIVPEEDPFAHNELVSCIGCSKTNVLPNAKIVATGGWDGTIRSWRWNPNVGLSGGHCLSGHTDRVEFLSIADYSNAGAGVIQKPFLCVSGGRDNTIRVWDLERSRETRKMYVFDAVTSGAVDWQSATIAVGSRSGALALWDLNTGQKRASIRGHQNDVTCVISYNEPSLDGAGLFVSGGADGVVKVWDPRQEVAAATMTGHRRRVFSVCAGPPGVIFAGDFSSSVKTHVLARPSAKPRYLPNAPRIDGCEAPISGLEYCSLPNATPKSATNQKNLQSGQPAGVLVSTAAYFPPSQKSKETPLSKAVSNIASTLLLRKTSANASSDHHKDDLPVLETVNSSQSQTSNLSSVANMDVSNYYDDGDDANDTSGDSDDSDSSDAPFGLFHVRCVDGQGVGLSGSLFVEREEGEVVLDSDVDINGGYLYSLPGAEGLLTCAAMSANESTSEVSIFAGAASGAVCAWSQGGSLTGLSGGEDENQYSDDEFHKDWMMNQKTDGFWKSEFSESVDVGCEKYSVD